MYIETRDLESRPFRRFIGVPSGCTSSSICIYWYTCLFSDLCSLCKIMLAEAQQSIEKRNPETYNAKMCRTEQPGLALFPFLPYLQPLSVGTRVWVYPLHCEAHSCSQSENVLCGSSINVLSLLTLTSKTSRIFQTAPRWDEKTCLGACNFTSIQEDCHCRPGYLRHLHLLADLKCIWDVLDSTI